MKTYGIVGLALLLIIVVFQNAESVSVRFLAWNISMSLALLLPLTFLLGALAGFIATELFRRKS